MNVKIIAMGSQSSTCPPTWPHITRETTYLSRGESWQTPPFSEAIKLSMRVQTVTVCNQKYTNITSVLFLPKMFNPDVIGGNRQLHNVGHSQGTALGSSEREAKRAWGLFWIKTLQSYKNQMQYLTYERYDYHHWRHLNFKNPLTLAIRS